MNPLLSLRGVSKRFPGVVALDNVSLEVGKNRLESVGEIEETADLIRYCIQAMEANDGFEKEMAAESDKHHNRSVLKPFGVWGVISPFNFPAALSGGPSGAALLARVTSTWRDSVSGAGLSVRAASRAGARGMISRWPVATFARVDR